jgi:hypothetical protein
MILRMKGKKRLAITVKCSTYFLRARLLCPEAVLAFFAGVPFGLRRMTSFNQLSAIRQGGNICLRAAAVAANDDVAIEVKNWKHLFKSH